MCFFILHFESTLQPKFWHNHELTVMVADICNYPMENTPIHKNTNIRPFVAYLVVSAQTPPRL